jgi:hypothetical protein
MLNIQARLYGTLRRNTEREQKLDSFLKNFSYRLWPYKESKLLLYVGLLALLDYTSTFNVLELSGRDDVYEAGMMANWALNTGGFLGLFLFDVVAIGVIIGLAFIFRARYKKAGLEGFGRAAFLFMLVPYFLVIIGVVVNNVLLAFL